VSRRHAHIPYERAEHLFRLHDDGSEHGTGVVRHGRTFAVPGGTRGVRLESGDEIVLGDARCGSGFRRRSLDLLAAESVWAF
jgi:pSer/pThr/pTyr-binding forkhead associated (FHA) protein